MAFGFLFAILVPSWAVGETRFPAARHHLTGGAQRFHITDRQVRQIEQEGLDGNWPPLE